jgi:hypothetical protein
MVRLPCGRFAMVRNGRAAGEDVAAASMRECGGEPGCRWVFALSAKVISNRYGRHERSGRLVKRGGAAGEFAGSAADVASSTSRGVTRHDRSEVNP